MSDLDLTPEQQEELVRLMTMTPPVIEFRAYYNTDGSITTYTTEDLPGDYVIITREQYAEARSDARVIDGILIYIHRRSHVSKLAKNRAGGVRTSKYDVSIITDDEIESVYYTIKAYEIKR